MKSYTTFLCTESLVQQCGVATVRAWQNGGWVAIRSNDKAGHRESERFTGGKINRVLRRICVDNDAERANARQDHEVALHLLRMPKALAHVLNGLDRARSASLSARADRL